MKSFSTFFVTLLNLDILFNLSESTAFDPNKHKYGIQHKIPLRKVPKITFKFQFFTNYA